MLNTNTNNNNNNNNNSNKLTTITMIVGRKLTKEEIAQRIQLHCREHQDFSSFHGYGKPNNHALEHCLNTPMMGHHNPLTNKQVGKENDTSVNTYLPLCTIRLSDHNKFTYYIGMNMKAYRSFQIRILP